MNIKLLVLWSYVILFLAYAIGTILIPPEPGLLQRYHITLLHLHVLDSTIIILYGAIWFCALYGFNTLYEYLKIIKKNKDGKALMKITVGIGFLAYWLPVSSNFTLYTSYLVDKNPNLTNLIGALQNYLSLILPLIGFIFISIGARFLCELTKQRIGLRVLNSLMLLLIAIGVTYTHLISTTDNKINAGYHEAIPYVLITFAIPYIYMWGIGILSAYEIHQYRLKAPGVVYRKSWRMLAFGLGSLISITIILQYLITISQKLDRMSFNWILMLVYVLLIVIEIAYVLIAIGVRALKRIEEV
jgi:hypothetical protein